MLVKFCMNFPWLQIYTCLADSKETSQHPMYLINLCCSGNHCDTVISLDADGDGPSDVVEHMIVMPHL